ncbi:MAG: sugar ABC transporter permease [Gemmatimonadota bacterium]|jgi:multiple sugar transport system permease protein
MSALTGTRVLSAVAGAILLATLGLGLLLPRRAVRLAEGEVLRAEAGVAQQLLAETGDPAVATAVLGDRWRETGVGADELLDRPVLVERSDGRRVARAARFGPDRWTVVGALEVEPPPDAPATLPGRLVLAGAGVGGLLLGLAVGWVGWAGARDRGGAVALPALVALAVIGVPLAGAGMWSVDRLGRLTDRRMALGVAALDALPDPGAVVERPGGVAQLTGLPFLLREAPGRASFSTLLPATTDAVAALPSPPPSRVTVDRSPWALATHGNAVLALTPFEHTRSPWGILLGVALTGVLLAAVPVTLAPLVRRRSARELRRNLVAWGFLAPAGLHLAVFTLGPLAFALWLSLHEWSLVDPARPFVGLANYAGLLGDGEFWNAIGNTALFTLHVPVAMAVALCFALLVHRRAGAGRAVRAVRAVLFLPTITSLVAIAVVWQWMLNDQYGLLNWTLERVGLDAVPWLTSPRTALPALMLMSVWLVVGYQMVLFQAGLAAIPEELYDAARIDGAGPWRRFVHVTLPGLRHTLFFVLVTSVIGSFQVFGAVYVMTEGGPLGATDVAVYHIYQEAWEFLRFGNAAAMSWVLFALIFAVTWLHFRLLERRAGDGEATA